MNVNRECPTCHAENIVESTLDEFECKWCGEPVYVIRLQIDWEISTKNPRKCYKIEFPPSK